MDSIKRFIPYYKPYKKVFFLDLLCATIFSVIDLVFPQLIRLLNTDAFTGTGSAVVTELVKMGLLLLVLYVIRAACRYYVTYQGHMMGARMESGMRRDLFEQFERFSFSYYDKNNTGEMMSKLISDLFDISELAHHGPENIFISSIKLIGSLILLMLINVPMTLILLAVVIVMVLFSKAQNKKMRKTFYDNRQKVGGINASLQDTLGGIRVVKSFTGEQTELEKFNRSNDAFLESKRQNYRSMSTFHTGNNFFEGLLYVVVLLSGGFFIANGSLTVKDIAIYALYINVFVAPINVLIEFTELLQKGLSGFTRFLEVMDVVPEIQDAEDARDLQAPVKGVIDFENVSFSYGEDEDVLSGVNIHVEAGKNIAFAGPSGGGKTTLCSLIPRFYDVTGGCVKVDGQDVRSLTQKSLREAIGIVQQDVYLFSGTIRENIAYGKANATMEEVIEAAKKASIHDFIQSLPQGYDTFVGERGARLSGGQKQRISIARVFLKNPPILILDEATSALDNESERYIQQSLDELAKGRTTITIAHRLSTIKHADEIIVIDPQGIRERGTHEELIRQDGIYKEYFELM